MITKLDLIDPIIVIISAHILMGAGFLTTTWSLFCEHKITHLG